MYVVIEKWTIRLRFGFLLGILPVEMRSWMSLSQYQDTKGIFESFHTITKVFSYPRVSSYFIFCTLTKNEMSSAMSLFSETKCDSPNQSVSTMHVTLWIHINNKCSSYISRLNLCLTWLMLCNYLVLLLLIRYRTFIFLYPQLLTRLASCFCNSIKRCWCLTMADIFNNLQ